jgi:hypothetical protein
LTRAGGPTPALQELCDEAAGARSRSDMMDIATKLYRWRRGLTHGR